MMLAITIAAALLVYFVTIHPKLRRHRQYKKEFQAYIAHKYRHRAIR